MPGPSNKSRKARKSVGKSQPRTASAPQLAQPSSNASLSRLSLASQDSAAPLTPPLQETTDEPKIRTKRDNSSETRQRAISASPADYVKSLSPAQPLSLSDLSLLQKPVIYDPGNGPRVRDMREFLDGSFFAQPPSLENDLCREFAQEEVLQMLSTVLPEETALVLWYNKSRATSRICPSCKRLYRLGDILPSHGGEEEADQVMKNPQLLREQEISGLCSPVCFILASLTPAEVIKASWGRIANEIDQKPWDILNGPVRSGGNTLSDALALLVRMTRLHDLGLAQLCFPEMDFEEVR